MLAKELRDSWKKANQHMEPYDVIRVFNTDYVNHLEAMILESVNRASTPEEMSDSMAKYDSAIGNSICPRCHKPNCYAGVAHQNAEAYGGRVFRLACLHCQAPLLVDISRITVVNNIRLGQFDEDDWGNSTKLI